MMRYRIDDGVSLVADAAVTHDFIFLSAVIGVLIGVVLVWAGWHGRQWWLVTWCGGLVIASLATMLLL